MDKSFARVPGAWQSASEKIASHEPFISTAVAKQLAAGHEKHPPSLHDPLRAAASRLRNDTRTGSRRNFSAHYDQSNDFFALMFDPTMTCSSGIFPSRDSTPQEASIDKYDGISRKLRRTSADQEARGSHCAETLAHWRRNSWNASKAVRDLGFDKRFIRTWHYYLCYCEAGFRARQIEVSQLLLAKPASPLHRNFKKAGWRLFMVAWRYTERNLPPWL